MNYYERHLGDYAKDTAHLSMLEHGAYGLLMDRYYATEQGIPADQAHRVARARTKEEKAAVDAVLAEFFVLVDSTWTKNRIEEEIAKAALKIDAARENGKKGGRPKNPERTQKKPSGLSLGSENITQPKALQTPDTKHQTPSTREAVPVGTGAGSQPSHADTIFSLGLPLLLAANVPERNARSMLGQLRKVHGDEAVIAAVQRCAEVQPSEPVSWLQASLKQRTPTTQRRGTSPTDADLDALNAAADAEARRRLFGADTEIIDA